MGSGITYTLCNFGLSTFEHWAYFVCACNGVFAVYTLCCRQGFARLRAARLGRRPRQGLGRGGAHEGRHARGWGHTNPWRQRLRATPSGDELSRITSR